MDNLTVNIYKIDDKWNVVTTLHKNFQQDELQLDIYCDVETTHEDLNTAFSNFLHDLEESHQQMDDLIFLKLWQEGKYPHSKEIATDRFGNEETF